LQKFFLFLLSASSHGNLGLGTGYQRNGFRMKRNLMIIMRKLLPACLSLPIFIFLVAALNNNPIRLQGSVFYNRPLPALEPFAINRERKACGEHVPNETLLVHKKGGLQNVLIFIANIAPEPLPPLALNLDIKACRFQPHVLALGAGSELTIRSDDPILHDVHARLWVFNKGWNQTSTLEIFTEAAESSFNFVFPQKGQSATPRLDQPGLIRLRSDLGHEWMSGYILVMPHRYFAVTDAEGKFELPPLPVGRYDLVLWHETLGVKRQVIEAKAGDKNELLIKWFPDAATTANQADSSQAN
jgi:hypothetical protein